MVRNSKRKALYEVIGRSGSKTGYQKPVTPLHPQPAEEEAARPPAEHGDGEPGSPGPSVVRWAIKPSVVQFNAGRIEFSVPYQIGILIVLAALLVVVVAFRLGERFGRQDAQTSLAAGQTTTAAELQTNDIEPVPTTAGMDAAQQPVSTGNNRIVIQMYQVRSHLEPVQEYFGRMGVATEILRKDNWYYLVTKNTYDNPERAGTDGYRAKQKIIELGAGYKAPAGYESFQKSDGTKPFSDAFGMRFE